MASGGIAYQGDIGGSRPPPPLPTSQFGNPATFTAAANTQASDYDKIMSQYDDLIRSSAINPITPGIASASQVSAPGAASANPVSFSPITGKKFDYTQSANVGKSLSDLSELTDTGGFSDADKQNIRERAISPTRSIYANAQQNVERQRALSGGYSPNFNATQAKMAREESDQISGINTNANAAIAQNVASNRISAGGAYASAAGSANAQQAAADKANADIINQINEFNAQGGLSASEANAANSLGASEFNISSKSAVDEANANRQTGTSQFNVQAALDAAKTNRGITAGALAGKTSLYGTTPALTNTFGNQVMGANQQNQNQQVINNSRLPNFGGGGIQYRGGY